MTATISLPTAAEAEDRSSSSPLRLSLSPAGPAPALLDGAWWPRSRDLTAELPSLTAVLDRLWGRITRVTVNPTHWPVVPRKVPVAGHLVKVGSFLAEQDAHELLLLSYHVGRWNLLVIPPRTDPVSAAWLMTAASDPLGTSTASRLVEEAVYVDTTTDEPAMATVRIGLPTRHRLVFVPLQDAIAGPDYVKVGYVGTLVKQAPSIGTDDVLPADQEEAIFKHYGLPYQAGAAGERQLARR